MSRADSGRRLSTEGNETRILEDNDVLLAQYQAQEVSHLFHVSHLPVRLMAFGLGGNDSLLVFRLWFAKQSTGFDECGELIAGEAYEMPLIYGCKPMVLKAESPELVLDMAGTYRLRYFGDNRPNVHVVKMLESVSRNINDTMRGLCPCPCKDELPLPPPPAVSPTPIPAPAYPEPIDGYPNYDEIDL